MRQSGMRLLDGGSVVVEERMRFRLKAKTDRFTLLASCLKSTGFLPQTFNNGTFFLANHKNYLV